jgi:hypothetical protein
MWPSSPPRVRVVIDSPKPPDQPDQPATTATPSMLPMPALVPAGLPLDGLETAFTRLRWTIPADELAAGLPPQAMVPRQLRQYLARTTTSYELRDQAWVAVVTRARGDHPTGPAYRLVAVGLALAGLRRFRRRIQVHQTQELPDVHADLIEGFLIRLATIDTNRRNIAGRLIGSAIGHAARRHRDRHDQPPAAEIDQTSPAPLTRRLWPHPESVEVCLYQTAARLAATDPTAPPIDPDTLTLIVLTRIDGHHMETALAILNTQPGREHKLPLEAAYKRRQRAEQRLAALLAPHPRWPVGSRHGPREATGDARGTEAPPAASTRQTAPRRERR